MIDPIEKQRAQVRASLAKRRARLKAEGLCVDCGQEPAETDRTLCSLCLEERCGRERKRQARKKVAA